MTLTELTKTAHEMAVEKGWYERPRDVPELLMLVVSELAEALEEARDNRWPLSAIEYDGTKPVGFAIEIADAMIRLFDLCGYYGIPIERAVEVKMAYNAGRERRHGGKKW